MTGECCRAWMLPLAGGRHAAIGEYEMVHIIPEWVRLQPIPHCPSYCHKVFTWQGQLVPVFDLHACTHARDGTATGAVQDPTPVICIVAYEDDKRSVGYGGLLLAAIPFRTEVFDEQRCGFPEDDGRWDKVAVSCFEHPVAGRTPVLDLPRIFCSRPGNEHRAAAVRD